MLTSSIEQVSSYLKKRAVSSLDLCKLCFQRIERIKELNAFITLTENVAVEQAKKSDIRHKQGIALGAMDGITFAVKDNFCTEGIRTTCGSYMLDNFVPPYTATVVERMEAAGGVLVGKCNLDEFAMGSGTVDSIYGPTKNIWGSGLETGQRSKKEWRIAGGSSGGCAAAVASGACFAALGSDTGGSTRNPASYCGIVGFKPTYSSVSRHGLIPLVNSLDVPGILTRNVQDSLLVYNIISGFDSKDSTTVAGVNKVSLDPNFDMSKVRVGIPVEYYSSQISQQVLHTCQFVVDLLQNNNVPLIEVSMPHTELSVACYSVLNQCEVASNMCRYDGLRFGHRANEKLSTHSLYAMTRSEGLNHVVRERILAGNYFLLHKNYDKYFERGRKVRRLICEDFKNAWNNVEVLLTPTTLTEAPLLDDYNKMNNREQCSIHDYCTQPVNMAGCPAISIPIRLSENRLPLCVQLIAANFHEQTLFSVAQWIQDRVSYPTSIMQQM